MSDLYKIICKFVSELSQSFDQHSLKLYARLLRKTNDKHAYIIEKHNTVFTKFVNDNKEQIINQNIAFPVTLLKYSEKCFIDFAEIFKTASKDDLTTIWKYLLTMLKIVNQDERILQQLNMFNNDNSNEGKFVSNFLGQISQYVDPKADSKEQLSSLLNKNAMPNLLQSMMTEFQSGKVDPMKLLQTIVTGMQTILPELTKNEAKEVTQQNSQLNEPQNALTNVQIPPEIENIPEPDSLCELLPPETLAQITGINLKD